MVRWSVNVPMDAAPDGPADLVQMGDRLGPNRFTLAVDRAPAPDIQLRIEIRDGSVECRELRIIAQPGNRGVRTSDLKISIDDQLELAVKAVMSPAVWSDDEQKGFTGAGYGGVVTGPDHEHLRVRHDIGRETVRQVRVARRAAKTKITDERLREVAGVYREHLASSPTRAVAEHFVVAHRTAALYVKRARGRGFLGAALPGKAGEA